MTHISHLAFPPTVKFSECRNRYHWIYCTLRHSEKWCVLDTHRVWITGLGSVTRGRVSRPRWLQSARAPLHRHAPRHWVRLWSLSPQWSVLRPPGSRCCLQLSMLGLTRVTSEARTRPRVTIGSIIICQGSGGGAGNIRLWSRSHRQCQLLCPGPMVCHCVTTSRPWRLSPSD